MLLTGTSQINIYKKPIPTSMSYIHWHPFFREAHPLRSIIPVASLFIEQFNNQHNIRHEVRTVEIQTIEKQLQETISENITKAFERLKQ